MKITFIHSRQKHTCLMTNMGHCTYCHISTRRSTQCIWVTRIPAESEFLFICTRNILKPERKIQKVNAQNYNIFTTFHESQFKPDDHIIPEFISYLGFPPVPASFLRLISPSSVAQLHWSILLHSFALKTNFDNEQIAIHRNTKCVIWAAILPSILCRLW